MIGIGSCVCCECVRNVLVDADTTIAGVAYSGFNNFKTALVSAGHTVHSAAAAAGWTTWSGAINDYHLVVLYRKNDPSYWSTITGGSWTGIRVVQVGENQFAPDFTNIQTWIAAASHSMTLNTDSRISAGSDNFSAHALAAGLGTPNINYNGTTVSGGSAVIYTGDDDPPTTDVVLAEETLSGLSWVVAGDRSVMFNTTGYTQLYENLACVDP